MTEDEENEGEFSLELMMHQMRVLTEYANEHLADAQREVTYGSYWARFYNVKERVIIFGHVETLASMEASERDLGAGDEEAVYIVEDTKRRHEDGYLYGMAYSVVTPEGELGFTHRADLWPIDEETFDAYRKVGWNVDHEDLAWETRVGLAGAYAEWASHTNRVSGQTNDGGSPGWGYV
jgi:hypothetical protein